MNYAVLPLKHIQANPCISIKIGRMPLDVDRKAHREYVCNVQEFNRILERFPADSNFYLSLVVPYNIGRVVHKHSTQK